VELVLADSLSADSAMLFPAAAIVAAAATAARRSAAVSGLGTAGPFSTVCSVAAGSIFSYVLPSGPVMEIEHTRATSQTSP